LFIRLVKNTKRLFINSPYILYTLVSLIIVQNFENK
jgi:hypothetical protein